MGGDKSGGPGDDKNLAADGDNSRPAPPTPRRAAEAVFFGGFGAVSHRGGPRARAQPLVVRVLLVPAH
ncbi:MAG TPA: hypothetical protein PJ982_17370, partial [Lacipirellulaceae bacterium]|nr:hypothetical protein [Lacipirellulaceae bacterium]